MIVGDPLEYRLRLLVVTDGISMNMVLNARKPRGMRAITLAKRIHKMTHFRATEVMRIFEEAG